MLVMILTAAASLFAVTSLALAPAQSATPTIKLCVSDDYKGYCLTREGYDTNFGNDKFCYYQGRYYTTCSALQANGFDDTISSFDNDTANWWKLFEHRDYKGYVLCVRPGGYDANIGNNTPVEDDISSAKMFGTSRPAGCDQVVG